MNLPPDKVQLLSQYDNEKKWELICDQVGTRSQAEAATRGGNHHAAHRTKTLCRGQYGIWGERWGCLQGSEFPSLGHGPP